MSEILSNTGVKLWSETDYNELWLTVFDQLTGQGGKSNIRLIDEAIGKINTTLDGYKFEFSSDEDRLYISKGDLKLPVSLIDSNGHVASKVDGTTITIDESGVVKGVPVDDALSEESTNPLQNKVIAGELKSIKSKMGTDESAIKQNTSDITSNTKRIEANETAISTLNGTGDGSVKKAVSDGIAEVVAGAPEDFDTLKEMSDWISTHETSASAMNSQIQDNKKAIDNHALNGDVHVTPENKTNWNKVSEKLDKMGDASNVTTEFTTATTRSNLTTKEKLSTSLGKISKWFSDLKAVAFSGSYNDLNDKPASLPANGGNSSTVNGHTVNSDVPANAKFTDTNTWRGIQNNLTSDSTSDSLSAAQGKALKGLVDSKAASSHTHSYNDLTNKPTLGSAASKTVRTLSASGASGWKDLSTDKGYVPDMAFMAYWNGAYSGSSSNLAYCNKGAFGSAATKDTNYFATASHSHTTTYNVTVAASSWSGSTAPYSATISIAKATTSNVIEVTASSSATSAQITAMANAMICNGTQAAGSITIKAYGDKPEINIPLTVIVFG